MRLLIVAFLVLACSKTAFAQDKSNLDRQLQQWDAIPLRKDLEKECSLPLKYATSIIAFKNKEKNILPALRWAEQESERSAAMMPSEPMLPIGTMQIIVKLIQRSYYDETIYSQIAGGFPQWVYKSCLKDKPLT